MAKGVARATIDSVVQPAAVSDFDSSRTIFNAFHFADNDFFNDLIGLDFANNDFADSGLEPAWLRFEGTSTGSTNNGIELQWLRAQRPNGLEPCAGIMT